MFRQREANPHFLPRNNNDPIIEFPSQPPRRSRPPPPHLANTSIEPSHGPRPQSPMHQPEPGPRFQPPMHQPEPSLKTRAETPPQHHQKPRPHPTPHAHPLGGRAHHHDSPQPHQESTHHPTPHPRSNLLGSRAHHHDSSLLRVPSSGRTKPLAWLVAAFCALFWIIIIIGGLIILTIYLVFRPKNPRFDINAVTLNAAYLDMGYLLNADVTVLANFTNPNTKVNVDFSYAIFELHYRRNFIATRYVQPFSVLRRESRFISVQLVSSQVRLSVANSLELQREIESGRVILELRGMFRARSKLGGIFQYSYWLNARCQIAVTGPPTGVLIGKRCSTK